MSSRVCPLGVALRSGCTPRSPGARGSAALAICRDTLEERRLAKTDSDLFDRQRQTRLRRQAAKALNGIGEGASKKARVQREARWCLLGYRNPANGNARTLSSADQHTALPPSGVMLEFGDEEGSRRMAARSSPKARRARRRAEFAICLRRGGRRRRRCGSAWTLHGRRAQLLRCRRSDRRVRTAPRTKAVVPAVEWPTGRVVGWLRSGRRGHPGPAVASWAPLARGHLLSLITRP
jgi:hypothetical protein